MKTLEVLALILSLIAAGYAFFSDNFEIGFFISIVMMVFICMMEEDIHSIKKELKELKLDLHKGRKTK